MAYLIDNSFEIYQYFTDNLQNIINVLSGSTEDIKTDDTETFLLVSGDFQIALSGATKFVSATIKGEFELGQTYEVYTWGTNTGQYTLIYTFIGTGSYQVIKVPISNWLNVRYKVQQEDEFYWSKLEIYPTTPITGALSKLYFLAFVDKSNDFALESYVDGEIIRVSGLISAGTSGLDGTSGTSGSSGVNGLQGTIVQDEDFSVNEGGEIPLLVYPNSLPHNWYLTSSITGLTNPYVTGGTVVTEVAYGGVNSSWKLNLSQNNIHLVNNQNYKYNIIAWSDQATGATMEVYIQDNNNSPSWKAIGTSSSIYSKVGGTAWLIPLTNTPTQFVFDFYINALSLVPNVAVYNQLATYDGITYIKNCFIQIDAVDGTSGSSGVNGLDGTSGSSGIDGVSLDTSIVDGSILYKENGVLTGSTLLTFSGNSLLWMPTDTTAADTDYWTPATSVGLKLHPSQNPTASNGVGFTIGKRSGDVGHFSLAMTARQDLPTVASGWGSIGWGLQIDNSGGMSIAAGQTVNNTGYGNISVGNGLNNAASYSAAFGGGNIITSGAEYGAAFGGMNTVQGHSQLVCGYLAIETGSTIANNPTSEKFIVGAGTDGDNKFNAFTVSHNSTKVFNDLVLPKVSGSGIKIDTTNPQFGWKDLVGQIVPKVGGGTAPTLAAIRGTNVKAYVFSVNDVIDNITFHLPHDYVPGTQLFIHTHFTHNGTAISGSLGYDYYVTYSKGYDQAGGIFNSEITLSDSVSITNITSHPQWGHSIKEIQLTSATGSTNSLDVREIEVDGLIVVGFKVTSIPTITGGVSDEPFILMLDIHYQSNGVMGTYDKNYPFYQ